MYTQESVWILNLWRTIYKTLIDTFEQSFLTSKYVQGDQIRKSYGILKSTRQYNGNIKIQCKQLLFTIIVVVILGERMPHTTSHVYEKYIEIAPKVYDYLYFIFSNY